jgi:hypothetical protein
MIGNRTCGTSLIHSVVFLLLLDVSHCWNNPLIKFLSTVQFIVVLEILIIILSNFKQIVFEFLFFINHSEMVICWEGFILAYFLRVDLALSLSLVTLILQKCLPDVLLHLLNNKLVHSFQSSLSLVYPLQCQQAFSQVNLIEFFRKF